MPGMSGLGAMGSQNNIDMSRIGQNSMDMGMGMPPPPNVLLQQSGNQNGMPPNMSSMPMSNTGGDALNPTPLQINAMNMLKGGGFGI